MSPAKELGAEISEREGSRVAAVLLNEVRVFTVRIPLRPPTKEQSRAFANGCRVRSEGPQHVTVHGREEVVVIAAEEFRRLQGARTGQALVDAIQASPHREIEIEVHRAPLPVRDVTL